MTNRKTIYLAFTAAMFLLVACGGHKPMDYYQKRSFPTAQVPVAITDDNDKLEWNLIHFWDRYLDTTKTYFCDTLFSNGVHNRELLQNAVMYSTVVARLGTEKSVAGLNHLMDKLETFQRHDTSSTVFAILTDQIREIFYGPNSPYRDEDKYLTLASRLAVSEFTPDNMRKSFEYEKEMCSLNRVGTKAPDFEYIDKYGRKHTLWGTKSDYMLIIFLNPGCHACQEVVEEMDEPYILNMVKEGSLTILGMYIDPEIDDWKAQIDHLPKHWKDGYDPKGVIRDDLIYNVRAIPSLYLLDKDKTIMLKDAPVQAVSTVLGKIINQQKSNDMDIKQTFWGKSPCGEDIFKYTMTNRSGASVVLSSVGAGIVSINVPDRNGVLADVVIGYDDPLSYFNDGPCAGKCPGRFANRIAKGKFTLDGVEYTLPINNGPNHLHGGPEGFQNKVWEGRIVAGKAVEFQYVAADGEMGYPGNLKVTAHYEWNDNNELLLTFAAKTDAPTVINMTNHTYFNLNGEGSGSIKDHLLRIDGSEFLPTDETLIPLGESVPVAGTPMDFVNSKKIGQDLFADFPAIKYGKGFDNCWVIDGYKKGQLQEAAMLYSEKSGRVLEVLTTQPGVQVYTGNWLEGCPAGKNGHIYHDYDAVAIECQHFPDSPNKPEYPTTELRPGQKFEEAIIFAFAVRE